MSDQQKAKRAKRLLSMVEQEREEARQRLAVSHQRLSAAVEDRELAEKRLHEDHRRAGHSPEWLLAELDQEARQRALRKAIEHEKKADADVAVAGQKALEAHQKHRVFERFVSTITDRIADATRRQESRESDAFALALWTKQSTHHDT
jgi:hypothetical protein